MTLNLTADEVLTTTRSVRKRLDLDKAVPREVLMECLEIALQAPTGSNAQGWQWMFVTDPVKKQALADIYRTNAMPYLNRMKPDYGEGDVRSERMEFISGSARYLAENLQDVPVLMIPCLEGKPETGSLGFGASFWASLFPAAWSYCLALRNRGLGSCWTTLHLLGDGEQQAAEVLGIPYENYSQGGLFPIAYTLGTDFKPAKRLPAEQVAHFDTW
ncbi:nitroreductase family protein [Mycobacterium sp. UM_Kg27]|uniref:nitroreductase family protein n=1 Tax=Mycobacterium sp. UM_Kg27 TaxID=1545693 RepID=UPI00061A9646|nr:nitroreductase family protein [Mycobacterium sp. UM_Kg27]